MSTKASIIIIDDDTSGELPLYVHSDWYPSKLGFDLFNWIYKYNDELKTIHSIDCFIRTLPRYIEDTWKIHWDVNYIYELIHERYGIACRCYKINNPQDIESYQNKRFEKLSWKMIFFIEPKDSGNPTWFNLDIKDYL